MMNFLALFLAPWLVFSSSSGNMVGSFYSNQRDINWEPESIVLLCEATAEDYALTHTVQCHSAIPFPIPEELK